jgi:hypothetical protein
MSQANLTTYLNDHLAGSVAALELLDHLIEAAAGSPDAALFAKLKSDIAEDQEVVRTLVRRFDGQESTVKKAGAWLAEKIGILKLHASGTDATDLGRLEALEGLYLGITGKGALWKALSAAGFTFEDIDLPALARRAADQRALVEQKRLEAARRALGAALQD